MTRDMLRCDFKLWPEAPGHAEANVSASSSDVVLTELHSLLVWYARAHKWMRALWYQLGLEPKPWNLESTMCQPRTKMGCEAGSLRKMSAFVVIFHIHNTVLLERLMLFLKASVLH